MTPAPPDNSLSAVMRPLRHAMEDLACHGNARHIPEDVFDHIVQVFLAKLHKIVDRMRFERAEGGDGPAVVAGDGPLRVVVQVTIDREAVAVALDAAKRDCDFFHSNLSTVGCDISTLAEQGAGVESAPDQSRRGH